MTTTASPLVLATDEADARAVDAVRAHHAELAATLHAHVGAVLTAARTPGVAAADLLPTADVARRRLLAFLTGELLPHAVAEEQVLYPAAARLTEAKLLVDAMIAEHGRLHGLVEELQRARSGVDTAATARALAVLFDTHLDKENELVLPLLAADPHTRLATLLDGMHELLGGAEGHGGEHDEQDADGAAGQGGCGGHCGCGERDAGVPVLDARTIPHAIRHATVLGAFDALALGASMDLVAPHDPVPLLHQLAERNDGRLGVEYLEQGPQAWRLRLTRA